MTDDWAAQRTEAARVQAERLAARQDSEHQAAEALLAEFVLAAQKAGLEPEPLEAKGYGGRGTARTALRGWYLRQDRAAGITADGTFYVLTAPLTVLDRVRGARLTPQRPPLILGAGGPDGSTIELPEALERVLPGWRGTDLSAT